MVKGRLNRESNPVPGEKPGFTPQHEKEDGSFANTGEGNPFPTNDSAVKAELAGIKQTQSDIIAALQATNYTLQGTLNTQLTGSNVEYVDLTFTITAGSKIQPIFILSGGVEKIALSSRFSPSLTLDKREIKFGFNMFDSITEYAMKTFPEDSLSTEHSWGFSTKQIQVSNYMYRLLVENSSDTDVTMSLRTMLVGNNMQNANVTNWRDGDLNGLL